MSFQLTLLSMLLLLIAVVVGQPVQSPYGDSKVQAEGDSSLPWIQGYVPYAPLYDEQLDKSPLTMEKKWANQVRFGKRASWASSVRFG